MWAPACRVPESAPHRNHSRFSIKNCTTNRSRYLFRTFDAHTDVTITVAHSNKRFEACAQAVLRHLLHRHNLQHVFMQMRQDVVNDLELL